eukprot:CAMPEP_0178754494 /NCGR_PEP_ID=MMETSP0744-20121128/12188_1 /TAXON_ID=913974 /ORGANISM="Nitzschia punctata, Strain CCMP561" /LENGTH=281 /DNA_ID=CAMNT_0020408407 /DNA_START=14 /DNA_END=859 /DNA_ORIENTATION=+
MSTEDQETTNNRLQAVNYANVFGYLANVLVVFGSTAAGLPDNGTLSAKYQTLVTPAGFAFAIWGIIFTAQFIWTVAQMLPAYRSSELVTKGVGYFYVAACLAQCFWTIAFGLEKIALSLLAMVLILIPLVMILNKISLFQAGSVGRYWLLKFPFEIHAAWIMAATLVNVNVVFVAHQAAPNVQTAAGWISLPVVVIVGLYYTMKKRLVVPCVLAWASFAIAVELSSPKESIATTFAESIVQATKVASGSIAAFVIAVVVVKVVYDRFKKPEEDSGNAYAAL